MFRIGDFEITSFGVLVALGALVGLWVLQRELRRTHLPRQAIDAAFVGVIGGLLGAKLLWTLEHVGEGPLRQLLLNRGGMSWFGGFAGGLAAGVSYLRWRKLPLIAVLAAATPALAVGHAIGRVGCLLVGDDYGTPTDLPWGIAFPEGLPPTTVPVHPTQIYEALALIPLAWLLLRWRRQARHDYVVLGGYLLMTGGVRFGIEFLRVNERIVAGLSIAHLASLAAVVAGATLLVRSTALHRDGTGGK
ncbi:prolipoprotein diacylglyceryl transferase [Luteitalea sp.]